MRGRKKLPDEIKVIRGTDQPVRMSPNAPKLRVEMPMPPDWLTETAKEAYLEIAGILLDMRVVTRAHRMPLILLCEAYADYRKYRDILQEVGETYTTTSESGTIYRVRPEVGMRNEAWKQFRSMCSEFGLTPSSATKVQAIGDNEEDPLEALKKRLGK